MADRFFGKDRVQPAEDQIDLQIAIGCDASKRVVIGQPFVLYRSGRTREEVAEFLRDWLEERLIAQIPESADLNWASLQVYITVRPQNNMFHGGMKIDIIERTAA